MALESLLSQIAPLVVKTLAGIAITGLLGVIMWPFRKAQKEWRSLKNEQALIHSELVQQRTNCLTTLQQQGVSQIELLTRTVSALDGVRLDLAEQTGYLKALTAQQPRKVRAVAAKK